MLAATTYRLAPLAGTDSAFAADEQGYIDWADELRAAISRSMTTNGTISPAINPLNWFDLTPFTSGSPEGQSFAGQLSAAYRDWACAKGGSHE